MRGLGKAITDTVGNLSLPTLGRDAEIDVYLVHNSPDPEDYFFLFDFEEFVARSGGGIFVRPVLRVYAGRDDFSRMQFARQFRAVFAAEFDRMRAELAGGKERRGWLDWNFGFDGASLISGLVANLVLAIALQAGRAVLGQIRLPRMLRGKSAEARLAEEIDRTKGQVETALERIAVTLHAELYDHAFREVAAPPVREIDREAWPLPGFVRAHMGSGRNAARW